MEFLRLVEDPAADSCKLNVPKLVSDWVIVSPRCKTQVLGGRF